MAHEYRKDPEYRAKISRALKGRKKPPFTAEHKANLSKAHKGKVQSEETIRKRVSKLPHGENHHWWKGGVTQGYRAVRSSLEYKLWRKAVFERDNYTCVWCKIRSAPGVKVILNADHIKPFAYFPELRFAIDNGRTLCTPCHKTTDSYAGKGRIYG